MECLNSENIDRYVAGAMQAREFSATDTHLQECAVCRQEMHAAVAESAGKIAGSLLSALRNAQCLDDDNLWAYAKNQMSAADREIAQAHLDGCPRCFEASERLCVFLKEADNADWPAIKRLARSQIHVVLRPISWPFRGAAFAAAASAIVVFAVLYASWVNPLRQKLAAIEKDQERARAIVQEAKSAAQRLSDYNLRLRRDNQSAVANADLLSRRLAAAERGISTESLFKLRDGGGQVAIDSAGRLTIAGETAASVRDDLQALAAGRSMKPPAAIAGLTTRTGALMGSSEDAPFALYSPRAETVSDVRPEFRWQPLAGALRYQITVVDDETQSEMLSGQLPSKQSANEVKWHIPPDCAALTQGKTYRWFVMATLPDGKNIESPLASGALVKFRVIDTETRRKLTTARRESAGSHLVMGLLYRRAGLLDDARREFELLEKSNPKEPLPIKLLRETEQLRQRP